jgi:histone H3/H4
MAKKKTTKKKSAQKESLVVGSKVKAALKGTGKNTFNVSADTIDAMNEYVYWLVDQAQKRCEANGRKTIRPHDILAM